jgi:hypothetical protein
MSVIGSNILAGASGAGGDVPFDGYLAAAHNVPSGPAIVAYAFTTASGFGSAFSDPSSSSRPTSDGRDVAFHPDATYLALLASQSPYVWVYSWSSSGFGSLVSNPSSLPSSGPNRVAFSPDGNAIAIGNNQSPYIEAYSWSSGWGSKYSNPSTLPQTHSHAVAWHPDGDYIAVATQAFSQPFCIYPWSNASGFGTKVSDPSFTGNSRGGYAVDFHPDGNFFALGENYNSGVSVSTIHVWAWSSGFGTKQSAPSSYPQGKVNAVKFSPNGEYIAAASNASPDIHVWPWSSSGFGSPYSNPSTLPGNDQNDCAWTTDSAALVSCGSGVSPYVHAWAFDGGFGSKYSNPSTLRNNTGRGIDLVMA